MSEDNEPHRRWQVPWPNIATLAVTIARLLLDLIRKG
jgi:hypothetical protein